MTNYFKLFLCAFLYAFFAFTVTSCDKDEFFDDNENTNADEADANGFDFSTTRQIDLIVEYNGFETCGPVRFSVYNTNPIVGENTDYEHMNENIKPIIELYTDERGKFDQTISLPAYAKVLHIVTGNLAIGFDHSIVEVVNNEANVVVKNDGVTMDVYHPSRITRAAATAELTDELGKLKSTGYKVDSKGAVTTSRVYKEWGTPLGKWNVGSGRPEGYLLDKTTVTTPMLVLSDKEVTDMYSTACNILPNNSGIDNSHYRTSADITLKEESEVTITALGSFTCWNSSLAYYYYNESNKPKKRTDLNPIMLFPNTQDGKRYTGDINTIYKGNIGMVRGDVIQLMYYPNIANGDYSGATTMFPKGTKIGFLMRTNGWGMMGTDYCTKTYSNAMNIWVSSTEGMSFAEPFSGKTFKVPNDTGEARTALFSYSTPDNKKFCILSFEDACDDKDYNDLIFALNPANVFLGLNEVEKDKTTTFGVYAFEDMWPLRGDYDMNDVVVDCQHELTYSSNKVIKEVFYLTTYQNYVKMKSGLALKLETKVTPTITMKKIVSGQTKTASFTKEGDYYYLTDNITKELGTTYVLELSYSSAQSISNIAKVKPFIWRDDNGRRWEVHIPYEAPSPKMDMSYFGTGNDKSIPAQGKYYIRSGNYSFAFYLDGAKAEYFMDNILKRENESVPINTFFPGFLEWSVSDGKKNPDWYLHPINQ